jgi:hypothetical protein
MPQTGGALSASIRLLQMGRIVPIPDQAAFAMSDRELSQSLRSRVEKIRHRDPVHDPLRRL